jgi:hypothetical protein
MSAHCAVLLQIEACGFTKSTILMRFLGVLSAVQILHLPPAGRVALFVATFLAVVFGLDDLVGPTRTNAWAASWLSASTRFFQVFARGVFGSAAILKIIGIVAGASIVGAASVVAMFWLMIAYVSHVSTESHVSAHLVAIAALLLLLYFLSFASVIAVGVYLRFYFETIKLSEFLADHAEFVEVSVIRKFAAWLGRGLDYDVGTLLFERTSSGRRNFPVHAVFLVAWIPMTLTMIVSLVIRTLWLVFSCTVWFLLFAPAQALNAIARRTGAENLIKVGKYMALLAMSIYGLIHD